MYVIILPAFGIISALLEDEREAATPSFLGMVVAIWSIGLVGYFVWSHHMFVVGMSDVVRAYFACATLVIGVPTAVKIFAWSLSLGEVSLQRLKVHLHSFFPRLFYFRRLHWSLTCKR